LFTEAGLSHCTQSSITACPENAAIYIVHKLKLANRVYIYTQHTAKICVTEGFCYITKHQHCNATSQHGSINFRMRNIDK